MLVCEAGQGLNFVRLVDCAHFCCLGNGDHSRLDVMLVANAVIGIADGFNGKFAIRSRNRDELAAGELFGRAAFVGVNMGNGGTDHSMERIRQSL